MTRGQRKIGWDGERGRIGRPKGIWKRGVREFIRERKGREVGEKMLT